MNVGDSVGNQPLVDLKCKKSMHIFDGAGENVQYHSDSESLGSRKSRTRYINPAIYIEPVEASRSVTSLLTDSSGEHEREVTPHPHYANATYRSNSTPMLSGRGSSTSIGSVKRISCRLSDAAEIPLVLTKDEEVEATPRNHETFRETYRERDRDRADTFRLSVASLSTTTTVKEERERNERKKQQAFQQWLARKEQEKREKARMEKLKHQAVTMPTPQQREKAFKQWCERKRAQDENKKAEEIMRRYREHERLEQERNQRIRNKEEKLAEWVRKKEDEMKAMKTKEERKAARAVIEEKRRRAAGERAYRDWLRTCKNKPLPVPLNQGELSMRGSVSQMYINPIPWQSPT